MVKSVTVRAPCSTANLGPGFDVFGMALDAFYDEVTVTKKPKSFGIKIVSSDDIPLDPKKNTAGIVAMNIKKDLKISDGLEIKIKKNVPAGYGMGSSAASAAACAIAIKELFFDKDPWIDEQLLGFAGSGEKASAGAVHYDNVAASLFGGSVVVNPYTSWQPYGSRVKGDRKISYIRHRNFSPCNDLQIVVGIPKISVPKQKTKASRGLLPKNVKFANAMKNLAFATSLTAELSFGKNANPARIARNIQDIIVEPARKKMIPGFDQVKKNALSAGAKACTISGAGPSVIAFVALPTVIAQTKTQKKQAVKKVGEAMKKGFKSAKVDCEIIICKPSDGPKIIKRK